MKERRLLVLAFGVVAALLGSIAMSIAQQAFKSPEEAVNALVASARAGDSKALLTVLGPAAAQIVSSGDAVADDEGRKTFVAAYDASHRVDVAAGKPATLIIGDDYPFPIPIVEKNGSWSFDAAAGREEILARRIGRNELSAIQVCLAYFDAQNEYADMMPRSDGMAVYASKLVSSQGRKDGLYWASAPGEPQSPIGRAVADATQRGYKVGSGAPFHGYYYRILTRQGPAAGGGALNYLVGDKMVGGFALVAYPAEYGNSGLTTFIVSHSGDIYEKNLGPNTRQIASQMTAYNPDSTWKLVQTAVPK